MEKLEKALIGALAYNLDLIKSLPEEFNSEHLNAKNARIFNYLLECDVNGVQEINLNDMVEKCLIEPSYIVECKEESEKKYTVGWIGYNATALELILTYKKKKLLSFLTDIKKDVEIDGPENVIPKIEDRLEQIKNDFVFDFNESVLTMASPFIDRLKQGKVVTPIKTGIDWFDEKHPMIMGELHILGGREGLCKSAFTLKLAVEAALRQNRVYYWSLEMKKEAQMVRVASILTGLNSTDIEENRVSEYGIDRIQQSLMMGNMKNLFLEDREIKKSQLENIFRKLKPQLMIIDFIQQMSPITGKSREESVAANVRWLKSIAMKYNCVVLAISQFHRRDSKDKRAPQNSDFRESGVIEQIADGTMLLYSPEDEAKNWRKQEIVFKQGKMRRTRKFKIHTFYDPVGYKFEEVACQKKLTTQQDT